MPGYARPVAQFEGRELLRSWIERSGRNQKQAAEYLGISEGFLSQWLSGKRRPSLEVAFDLEAKTGVPARSWTLTAVSKIDQAGRGNGSKR